MNPEDAIQIDIRSDTSQGVAAAAVIQEMADVSDQLHAQLDKAREAQAKFVQSTKAVGDESAKTADKVDRSAKAAERAAERAARTAERAAERAAKAAERAAEREKVAAERANAAYQEREVSRIRRDSTARQDAATRAVGAGASGVLDTISDPTPVLDYVEPQGRQRLTGVARKKAYSQLGLFVANTTQDVAQGGWASGINNVLGVANNEGIKSLLGEGAGKLLTLGSSAVAAAGGIGAVALALTGAAAAAGAAFLAIDAGLKSAKLGWSELDDVIGNLAPVVAMEEAFTGAFQTIGGWVTSTADSIYTMFADTSYGAALIADVEAVGYGLSVAVGWLDSWTFGLGEATEAARQHKDELARGLEYAKKHADAAERLAKAKSDDQERQAETGKAVDKAIANAGGKGGSKDVLDRMASKAAAKGADDLVDGLDEIRDDHGKRTGKFEAVKITRKEAMRRWYEERIGAAGEGDPNALRDVVAGLRSIGVDPSGVIAAAGGETGKKAKADAKAADREKKAADRKVAAANKKAAADAKRAQAQRAAADKAAKRKAEQAKKAADRDVANRAKPLQRRFDRIRGAGRAVTAAQVQAELVNAGLDSPTAAKLAPDVLRKLSGNYDAAVAKRAQDKGITPRAAALDLENEARAKDQAKADAAKDKAEREKEETRKTRLKKAEDAEAGTGLDARGEAAMLASMLGGGSNEQIKARVEKELTKELMGLGLSRDEASSAAKDKSKEWFGKVGDDMTQRAMDGMRGQAPQRIGLAAFGQSVESAETDLQRKMVDYLGELVQQGRFGKRIGP